MHISHKTTSFGQHETLSFADRTPATHTTPGARARLRDNVTNVPPPPSRLKPSASLRSSTKLHELQPHLQSRDRSATRTEHPLPAPRPGHARGSVGSPPAHQHPAPRPPSPRLLPTSFLLFFLLVFLEPHLKLGGEKVLHNITWVARSTWVQLTKRRHSVISP
jgi:hypothetical protein